ncbi:MAG: hypothetical protein R3C17_18885 [Planctomycetaceae bacterium]
MEFLLAVPAICGQNPAGTIDPGVEWMVFRRCLSGSGSAAVQKLPGTPADSNCMQP